MCGRQCEVVHFIGEALAFKIVKEHVRVDVGPIPCSMPLAVFRETTALQQLLLNQHDGQQCEVLPFDGKPKKGRRPAH